MLEGLIVKDIGGFYYVETTDHILYECRARGIFRKEGIVPLTGDHVLIETAANEKGTICEIKERKNELVRPPLANLDRIFMVVSVCDPLPNYLVIDQFLAVCEFKGIEPVIIITKNDLKDTDELVRVYQNAGFIVKTVCNHDDGCADEIKPLLKERLSAFIGNTGVGKSSLLNRIDPEWNIKTAHTSRKLGRGRHTTRHVELYRIDALDAYVADTPGFSTVDMLRYGKILKDDLQYCFREFEPFLGGCKFTGCSHTVEKGCAVLAALKESKIELVRHQSYTELYKQAKNIKEWEL